MPDILPLAACESPQDVPTAETGEAPSAEAKPTRAAVLADLAALPDDTLVTADDVAVVYAASVRHVWRMADRGDLPRPLKVGRLRRWRIGDLREHIRTGRATPRKR